MTTNDRFKFTPAVYLVLRREDQVLLLQRQNTGYMDGYWGLPAGHHDGGQTLKEAMCREAKEEIGVDIAPVDLTFLHVMHRDADDGERVDFYFGCTRWTDDITNTEPHKCAALTWFPLNNLPANTITVVHQALELIANNITYSEASE